MEKIQKIREIIADQLGVDIEEVTDEKSLTEDLGADSLDMVDLVMAFEDEFGVKVEDSDLSKINTVKDVIDLISARV
ncbi:acyl carrier protein [Thermosipho africanus H17ap60334]|jgi:acyl carrier protein|uniref:Acyl carrier protein n=2 Tax=Thermosipho TaxID=2420 RepID=A0A841GG43_9BACT|nr:MULTISPECIES: acyl carrier protein [Thermosipho]HCF38335.1 acyl carrier protein [Thermosipho africanus]ACJ75037.1 acyl carrier protein [Thermosipho africanus TCF52B]EKF50235.1 acyl carrier protein [Thermosipho africanus H17ap60334]MBB6062542.1 acyl carrier protein [Thermosipho japonicus]MBZ4649486.1 acpP1 [Thermosipho sp. (in: thermotogales)]